MKNLKNFKSFSMFENKIEQEDNKMSENEIKKLIKETFDLEKIVDLIEDGDEYIILCTLINWKDIFGEENNLEAMDVFYEMTGLLLSVSDYGDVVIDNRSED